MNKAMYEPLSAAMDGEAGDFELRRLLAELDSDPQLRESWQRFHLARDAIHGERHFRGMDISLAVRSVIDAEPAPSGMPVRDGFRRGVASFAIAATVTAVAVLGGQQLLGIGTAVPGSTVAMPVGLVGTTGGAPVAASYGARPVPALQPSLSTAYRELAQQRFKQFGQQHAEQAALNTPQGLLPFARVPEIDQ